MYDKLEGVEARFLEIESKLSDAAIVSDRDQFRKLSQEHSDLQELVSQYRKYKTLKADIQSNKSFLGSGDAELEELAKQELKEQEPELTQCERRLQVLLLPKDPNDAKNVILEIRAGAGGDEAAIFVGDLFRMYQRYAEKRGWKMELLSANPIGVGGFKEIIANVEGDRVFSRVKYEGGVHRVQRVPATENQGRIHTSTVTVAVLPEAEEVDVQINPADLRIDVYRSGGKGGQSVNTTDSAVRITHLPSGLVVACQDERSQLKNKNKAMKVLRSRLLEREQEEAARLHSDKRRKMVGTGDRSERIRTYNYPQGRLTDHRIGLTLYNLPEVMEGKIEEILDQLEAHYQMEALKEQGIAV